MSSEGSNLSKRQNPLGQLVEYVSKYQPNLLFAIARSEKRREIGISRKLPFVGDDIWNAYELSWLNLNGVPRVATAEFKIPATSQNIVESKSLKLYLNSFNQTKFKDQNIVGQLIRQDLEKACLASVDVKINNIEQPQAISQGNLEAICIDDADIIIDSYQYDPSLLSLQSYSKSDVVEETLCSHLFKSNCLITSQPDWATIYIRYKGRVIEPTCLLAYLISFRNHNEYHEQCVERIYSDIMKNCKPEKLTVYARYTRRGGLDINPWRSNFEQTLPNLRLIRQ